MVAIKCVPKKSLNKASMENLLTEIEILKGIQHPHIVQLKDFQVRAWGRPPPPPPQGSWRKDILFKLFVCLYNHSGTVTTSTSSWSSAQGVTCLASSIPAEFYLRRWLASSCSSWVKASGPSLTSTHPMVSAPLSPPPQA